MLKWNAKKSQKGSNIGEVLKPVCCHCILYSNPRRAYAAKNQAFLIQIV